MTALSLEISNPCNERCLHCYRTGDETRRGFLSLRQAQSAIEQAAVLGATDVTITGGEALLNPDWRGIVQAASDAGW